MRILASDAQGGIVTEEAPDAAPGPGELLVRVRSATVNPRDLRLAKSKAGVRPGMDFAGVVERAAGRSGPQQGARVAGVVASGAWSELIAVPARSLAILPDAVSFEVGAAVASTGLTALYALERGGALIGRRVLVTAAAGGVGRLACQLAALEGAEVTASTRSESAAARLAGLGVDIVVSEDVAAAASNGPFDLILDSVGGKSLTAAIRLLAPGGTCVAFGATAGGPSEVDAADLYQNGRTIVGFGLFPELQGKPASDGLARLFRLAANGRLSPPALRLHAFADANAALQSQEPGKIILTFSLD